MAKIKPTSGPPAAEGSSQASRAPHLDAAGMVQELEAITASQVGAEPAPEGQPRCSKTGRWARERPDAAHPSRTDEGAFGRRNNDAGRGVRRRRRRRRSR